MESLASLPKPLVDAVDAPHEITRFLTGSGFETEPFVTEEDSKTIVSNVFISVGLMIAAMIVTGIFYWSFNKNPMLFICILCALIFFYTVKVITITALMREQFKSKRMFMVLMGGTVFVCLLTLILAIMFGIKANQGGRSSSSSSSSYGNGNDYIPSNVNEYISQ